MPQQFSNNARALLTSGVSASDTSLVVEASKADLFPTANTGAAPVPAATNWFKCTLQDSAGNVEIVYVRSRTAGSGVMSNVLRGQEGTTARVYAAGTVVGLRVTAADLQLALAMPSLDNTFTGSNTFAQQITASGGVAGNVTGNVTGNVAGNVTGNVTGNLTGNVAGNVTGNVTGNLTGNASGSAGSLATTNWTVVEEGGKLVFKYGGAARFSISGAGAATASGDVTGFGNP